MIGAGQAGLAAGRALQRAGVDFLILEAGEEPGGSWPSYYDSLTLFSPVRYSSLPDLPMSGPADHYPARDEVAAYLREYARHFGLPIRTRARVDTVERDGKLFRIRAGIEIFLAKCVIVASGTFGAPFIPAIPNRDAYGGKVIHSAAYRSPEQYREHRVIVVGAANSAVQIAVELASVAATTLATREPIRYAPQRLLGKDIHFWFRLLGIDRTNWFSDQGTPVLDDGRYREAIRDDRPPRRAMFARFSEDGVIWSDGEQEKIDAVIFATGYRPHWPYLAELETDAADGADKRRALPSIPGIFFVGQPGLTSFASATLRGVGRDAEKMAGKVRRRLMAMASNPLGRPPNVN